MAGAHGRIVLRHVGSVGGLEEVESRPGVSVQSHNYRFELAAAAGIPYPDPDNGRPVGVFLKTDSGIFLYRLVLPTDEAAYAAISAFLEQRWEGSDRHVRRVRTTVEDLREFWPQSPLWLASLADADS